ncbi:hypothetical protein ES319_D07G108200v1 [Gossypium barbadense]|uniref:Uncharacterized protein n=1 Tax=Gossypium barbadense TaxID=3634 RepID=A0A5J5QRU8_GOSBA|nr:hypothetical protein ES319_D07G108200v1 [Gossypium barbadense]
MERTTPIFSWQVHWREDVRGVRSACEATVRGSSNVGAMGQLLQHRGREARVSVSCFVF